MGQLEDAFRDAADEVAQIKAQPSNRYWWLYGTIQKKNSNGTLDVMIDGVTIQQVKATVSCMTANVFDRVVVLKAGPLLTCVDVIATSDEVSVPASSISGVLSTDNLPSIPASKLPVGSASSKGILQVGSGLSVSNGVVSLDNADYVKKDGWDVFRSGSFCVCSRVWTADKNAYIFTQWGNFWESTEAFSPPDYPVTFTELPSSHISYVGADPGSYYAAFVERDAEPKTYNVGSVWLTRPNSGVTIGHPRFAILAAGTV